MENQRRLQNFRESLQMLKDLNENFETFKAFEPQNELELTVNN